jgi:hypothetical protein
MPTITTKGHPNRKESQRSKLSPALGSERLFVNKLLLAIIDAHPGERSLNEPRRSSERKRRLSMARLALLGEKTSREQDDFDPLWRMAFEYHRDSVQVRWSELQKKKSGKPTDPFRRRSLRALAKEAAAQALGIGNRVSVEDRLRSKFTLHKRYLLDMVQYEDDVELSIQAAVLKQVADLINPYLATNLDYRPLPEGPKRKAVLASPRRAPA